MKETNREEENNIKYITITLTKPKKRGRPSNENKRIFGISHIISIPENTPIENITEVMQVEVDKLKLPVKFVK